MSLDYAKYRLTEWGHWSRDGINGYPTHWATSGGLSRSAEVLCDMPLHIAIVDVIVRQLEVEPRRVLIVHYTQTGPGREKAIRIGMSKTTYFRVLEQAQHKVSTELEYADILDGAVGSGKRVA
jgi:predicted DNA-binding protein (UPF0251 family)